ncbi:MAG: hypothetical protein JKP90_16825 [Desulfofustis sp. PB-SRB1]|nr:hypothetical protein [Desulfofustis sp. PB-SRB1]
MLSVAEKKLLARVVGYYQHSFTKIREAWITSRTGGLQPTDAPTSAGFVNGSLKKILPEDPAVIKTLKNLGILNAKGNEIFYNCVVFPIYDTDGNRQSLWQKHRPAHGVSHLYLAGSRSGLVNRQAVPRSASIILTESIIDAVTLYDQGFTNVIPAMGLTG